MLHMNAECVLYAYCVKRSILSEHVQRCRNMGGSTKNRPKRPGMTQTSVQTPPNPRTVGQPLFHLSSPAYGPSCVVRSAKLGRSAAHRLAAALVGPGAQGGWGGRWGGECGCARAGQGRCQAMGRDQNIEYNPSLRHILHHKKAILTPTLRQIICKTVNYALPR